ncbi:hypothetical protein STEG23_013468, partial [Scotinomys teguina]
MQADMMLEKELRVLHLDPQVLKPSLSLSFSGFVDCSIIFYFTVNSHLKVWIANINSIQSSTSGYENSIVYMYHIFLIHSSVEGHLGCFQVLAITNNAAMNIVEHVSL